MLCAEPYFAARGDGGQHSVAAITKTVQPLRHVDSNELLLLLPCMLKSVAKALLLSRQ